MIPHGGPEVRDILTFNYDVQVLVAHGYQVFQPNFRGSSGYGMTFANLGRREWGGAMQDDLDDGLDHLVAEGLVDPGRACIVGTSYGGYAALAAATMTPELYQCVVAIAAPSDLFAMLKWERKEEGHDSESYQYWVNHIGDPRKDKAALQAVSPAKLADRVLAPILLIHGTDDGVVPIKQSEIMVKALSKAGKAYQFVELEGSAHSRRSDEDQRLEYETILAFLGTHLPVAED
jgi:dipeptidyl aminopeptidase/acylaminoacyl peptidase